MESFNIQELLAAFSNEALNNPDVYPRMVESMKLIGPMKVTKDEKYMRLMLTGYALGRYFSLQDILKNNPSLLGGTQPAEEVTDEQTTEEQVTNTEAE